MNCKESNALKTLLDSYIAGNKMLSTFTVRQFVHTDFEANIEQDVGEFLTFLLSKFEDIANTVEHKLLVNTTCRACNYTDRQVQSNYILLLSLPTTVTNSCTLQELLDNSLSRWQDFEGSCPHCGNVRRSQKTSITAIKQVLIVQLQSFEERDGQLLKINKYNIKGVPSVKLNICGNSFKVISVIYHHGETIQKGHYTCMLRIKNSWIQVNDLEVGKRPWPRNAKDAYLFFLERTENRKKSETLINKYTGTIISH